MFICAVKFHNFDGRIAGEFWSPSICHDSLCLMVSQLSLAHDFAAPKSFGSDVAAITCEQTFFTNHQKSLEKVSSMWP